MVGKGRPSSSDKSCGDVEGVFVGSDKCVDDGSLDSFHCDCGNAVADAVKLDGGGSSVGEGAVAAVSALFSSGSLGVAGLVAGVCSSSSSSAGGSSIPSRSNLHGLHSK